MKQIFSWLGAALLVLSALQGNAAVLVQYTFTDYIGSDDAPYAAATVDPGVSAGGFTPAVGLGENGNWNSTLNGIDSTTGNPAPSYAQKPIGQDTREESFAGNAYWSITLTPDIGSEMSLTSLSFDLDTFNNGLLPSFYLSSNIGGFETEIGAVYLNHGDGLVSVDLSGAAFQNLAAPVEFRLYLWSENGGGSSGSRWLFDNVTVEGTVAAIPEPGTWMMLGLGTLTLLVRRKRN
jgi:hypothetical protein